MDNQTQTTQYDPQVVAMVRATKMQESGNNYNAPKEAAGISLGGAYQYQAPTWKAYAGEILGDSNAQFTPENQDKVTYGMMKKWKDAGLQPMDIAHMWNPGSPNYPTQVVDKLKKIVQGSGSQGSNQGYNPKPFSQPTNGQPISNDITNMPTQQPQNQNLGQQLIGETKKAGSAIQNTISGKINPVSGVIQTVGAAAGAVNDVVGAGLELIPGVKWLEQQLGQGVGKLAQTPVGQSVVKSIQGFQKEHPELSDDIGAGFNIVTAIPIFRGLGAIKNLAFDAAAQGLRGIAEKGAISDLTEVLARTGAGREALAEVPTGLKTLVSNNALPKLVTEGGVTRYATADAKQVMGNVISSVDKNELEPALRGVTQTFPMEDVKLIANDIATKNLSDPEAVNRILDRIVLRDGDNLTLEQLNQAKRDISKKMSEAAFGDPDLSNLRIARMSLQKGVETGASTLGIDNIAEINQKMGSLIKAQDMLDSIDGKTIKRGAFNTLTRMAGTAVGAGVGESFGNPLAGGALGYGATKAATSTLEKLNPKELMYGVLQKTAPGAVKNVSGNIAKVGTMAGVSIAKQVPKNIQTPTSALSIPVNQMNNETVVQEVEADAKPIVKGLNIQLSNGKIYKFPNSQALQSFLKEAGL